MNKQNDIVNGSIYKQLLLLFFPILFGTFFQQLYNTVDAVIVGNYVGKIALGAVGGTTGTLINLLVGFITGVASGATVVVAQFYGKGDGENVAKSVRTGMFLAVALGAFMTALGIFGAPKLLEWTKVPPEMVDYSLTYMRIYFAGLIPSMIYNMGAGILRAIGDSKRPLYFLMVSCAFNIVLDIIFVAILKMEVKGVAYATIICQAISCLLTLYVLGNSTDSYSFRLNELSCDKNLLSKIVLIGIPAGLQSTLYSISNIFIQTTVNGFGTDTIAAWSAFGKIDALFWMFSGAIGTATMTVAGQNFGAGYIDRVKETFKKGLVLFLLFASLISSFVYIYGTFILRIFTDDAAVIEIGNMMIEFLAPTWAIFSIVEILSSGIRACGDSLRPMLITAIGICGFRTVWIMFCAKDTILTTLYCYPLSWLLADVLFLTYYFSGIWLKICLKKREEMIVKD